MKKEEYINHLVQSLKSYDKVYTEESGTYMGGNLILWQSKNRKKGTLSGFVESLLGSMTEIILEIPDEIEKLHIESSNGDINLKKIKCENITLKTVNGDGKILLNDQGKTCYVCGKSIIGDIKVNQAVRVNSQEFLDLKDKEGIKVFFESVSGDGIVKVKGEVE